MPDTTAENTLGLALQMGDGPCLPCAGRSVSLAAPDVDLATTPGATLLLDGHWSVEKWENGFGLQSAIPDVVPDGFEDFFPIALPADIVTKLWFTASQIHVVATNSYTYNQVSYTDLESGGFARVVSSTNIVKDLAFKRIDNVMPNNCDLVQPIARRAMSADGAEQPNIAFLAPPSTDWSRDQNAAAIRLVTFPCHYRRLF